MRVLCVAVPPILGATARNPAVVHCRIRHGSRVALSRALDARMFCNWSHLH
ncbi:hypothetical protein ACVWZ3_005856 [Bradyrhizobium sp. i1.3.6]